MQETYEKNHEQNRKRSRTYSLFFHQSHYLVNDFIFYCITTDSEIMHLSFSEKMHRKAVRWIMINYPVVVFSTKQQQYFYKLFMNYFSKQSKFISTPRYSPFLDRGTRFQRQVWDLIKKIPYGETRTYGSLADELGNIRYARAVGQACHVNPLALIIPCHRVISAQGMGGFAGEISIKARLLKLEKKG